MYQNYPHNQQPAQQNAAPVHSGFAFALDESSAEKAGENPFITDSGAYIVEFIRAEYVRASTGTHGMKIRFKTDEKQQGTVTLNYMKPDGTKVFGADFINAILYLAGVAGFNWYPEADEQGKPIQVAGELAGVRIGVVVESVENQNDEGRHLELRQVFDPASRCTAGEARRGEKPEAVEKLLKRLG